MRIKLRDTKELIPSNTLSLLKIELRPESRSRTTALPITLHSSISLFKYLIAIPVPEGNEINRYTYIHKPCGLFILYRYIDTSIYENTE